MKDNETFEFENRTYINPDVSRDEQTAFIDTLRDIQAQNNAQIATETHNLGTDIEHPRGGLNGSEEYWKSLYQTPQTNAAVADMKAVAQQTALNDALTNYQNMLQDKYNQAYRDYQKRAYNYSRRSSSGSGGGSGGGDGSNDSTYKGDTEYRSTDDGSEKKVSKTAQYNIGGIPYTVTTYTDGTRAYTDGYGKTVTDSSITSQLDKLSFDTPPNPNDDKYYQTGEEQTEQIRENLQWPEWTDSIINVLKIFG